jgi:hypothetical protein
MLKTDTPYYYLVASLPELHFGQTFQYLDIPAYLQYIFEEIDESDALTAGFLFMPYDHVNLINYCLRKNFSWHPLSLYKKETLIKGINESSPTIPSYLYEFYDDFLKGKLRNEQHLLHHDLTTRYYAFVQPQSHGFLRDWLVFERDFRNILAAMSARRNGFSPEQQLIGDNSVTARLRSDSSLDFGLQSDFPFIEHLSRLADQKNMAEFEKQVDFIRWNKATELVTFSFFTFDRVVAFIIQLLIAHRWMSLDKKEGTRILQQKVRDMTAKVDILKSYDV